jgi:F0F1-type ATP synthase epsilon subunit
MKLSVYSLKKALYEGDATSVNVKTAAGEITVLDHHRPLISKLVSGTMKIVDAKQKEHFIPVGGGFLEIDGKNHAKLIVD